MHMTLTKTPGLDVIPAQEPASRPCNHEQRLVDRAVRLQIRKIPILLVGESGAGKEHLVRTAHAAGPRSSSPLIAVNCASIPRELIESELFGYAAGSFTGAHREGKAGKFLLADKGILFLDEIGDMCLDLQAVLLRVLETSEFFPVGASKPVRVDVQIIAATNVPIQQAVREGRFRRDLYYRLNGAQLIVPPLRERDDKLQIIHRILSRELRVAGFDPFRKPSQDVMNLFLAHPWPGNIRQLSNVMRTAINLSEDGVIRFEHLPDDFLEELNHGHESNDLQQAQSSQGVSPPAFETPIQATTLAEWERHGIAAALEACRGNVTHASRILGITRGTLYKKMALYGLQDRAPGAD